MGIAYQLGLFQRRVEPKIPLKSSILDRTNNDGAVSGDMYTGYGHLPKAETPSESLSAPGVDILFRLFILNRKTW